MKAGYTIKKDIYNEYSYDYIEVCNCHEINEIVNYYHDNFRSKIKSKNAVGKWKLKK